MGGKGKDVSGGDGAWWCDNIVRLWRRQIWFVVAVVCFLVAAIWLSLGWRSNVPFQFRLFFLEFSFIGLIRWDQIIYCIYYKTSYISCLYWGLLNAQYEPNLIEQNAQQSPHAWFELQDLDGQTIRGNTPDLQKMPSQLTLDTTDSIVSKLLECPSNGWGVMYILVFIVRFFYSW